jgi:histidinol phosphatase-like PHP family hydrolase
VRSIRSYAMTDHAISQAARRGITARRIRKVLTEMKRIKYRNKAQLVHGYGLTIVIREGAILTVYNQSKKVWKRRR